MKLFLRGCSSPGGREEVTWPSRVATFAFLVFSLLGVLGCNVGPRYLRPAVPAPSVFKESGPQQAPDGTVWKPAQPQYAMLRVNWSDIYPETSMNSLEEKFNISHQHLPAP